VKIKKRKKHLWKPNPFDPFGGFTCAACKDGSFSNKKRHKR
jgi:hypothetical protein